MSKLFRIQLVLMIFGEYGFGDYVTDPLAFELRLRRMLS